MFMGSMYSPELGANIFTKLAQKAKTAAKKVTTISKGVTKIIKKGDKFYKTYIRPDGTQALVEATPQEVMVIQQAAAPAPTGGFTLGNLGKYLVPVVIGVGVLMFVGRRRK